MTRGMIYAICDDLVLCSLQFNGDMYPSHYGLEIITLLQKSKKLLDVKRAIEKFNKDNHGYTNEVWYLEQRDIYFKGVTQFSIINKKGITDFVQVGNNAIDVSDGSDEGPGFNWTDWNFIKNLSKNTVTLILDGGRNKRGKENNKRVIELKPMQQIAINYDYYERHYQTIKQCEKLIKKEEIESQKAEAKRQAEKLKEQKNAA